MSGWGLYRVPEVQKKKTIKSIPNRGERDVWSAVSVGGDWQVGVGKVVGIDRGPPIQSFRSCHVVFEFYLKCTEKPLKVIKWGIDVM